MKIEAAPRALAAAGVRHATHKTPATRSANPIIAASAW